MLLDRLAHGDLGLAVCVAVDEETGQSRGAPWWASKGCTDFSAQSKKLIPQSYAVFMHSNVFSVDAFPSARWRCPRTGQRPLTIVDVTAESVSHRELAGAIVDGKNKEHVRQPSAQAQGRHVEAGVAQAAVEHARLSRFFPRHFDRGSILCEAGVPETVWCQEEENERRQEYRRGSSPPPLRCRRILSNVDSAACRKVVSSAMCGSVFGAASPLRS